MKKLIENAVIKLIDWLVQVEIDVHPTSPYYPAHVKVYLKFFNAWRSLVDEFRAPMEYHGNDVDVQYILDKYPMVKRYRAHFPDNWHDIVEKWRAKQNDPE
jgi:hypothetical protein